MAPSGSGRLAWRAAALVLLVFLAVSTASVGSVPGRLRVFTGQPARLVLGPAVGARARQAGARVRLVREGGAWRLQSGRPGTVRLDLLLWGRLPIGPLVVDVVRPLSLVPGGQAIGVWLVDQGVMVDRVEAVRDARTGRLQAPAQEAGLAPGDLLLEANDVPLSHPDALAQVVERAGATGQAVRLKVRRGASARTVWLRPVPTPCAAQRPGMPCPDAVRYAVGLVVREPAAGVGTLTFYDPATRLYGALGHMVQNRRRQPVALHRGRIVLASIAAVARGRSGRPGEKVGVFPRGEALSGSVEANTPVGIFGRLDRLPGGPPELSGPVPVALSHQVREGPATVLTVLAGERVESFAVEIVRIRPPGVAPSQRLLLRVVDPELLRRTGGIVQGMSGSPLLQDGRLVGAVTHVSVQDPTRGYGVLIEDMVEQSGLWGGRAGAGQLARNTPTQAA